MKKTLIAALLGATTLYATAASLFSDSFTYPDGVLTTGSGGVWTNHSGTVGQVDVQSGAVNLTQTESEDVNAVISGGPYLSGFLYYSLAVNLSVLPLGTGGYFAHLKDSTASGFRGRLFATTNGAAAGFYRLGINNGSAPVSATISTDLTLGSVHQAVVRFDAGLTPTTTLWVDPSLETDPNVTATDVVTQLALGISSFGLRQSTASGSGMGTLQVDNLKVATTFAEVIPEPTGLLPLGLVGLLAARKLRRRG